MFSKNVGFGESCFWNLLNSTQNGTRRQIGGLILRWDRDNKLIKPYRLVLGRTSNQQKIGWGAGRRARLTKQVPIVFCILGGTLKHVFRKMMTTIP